MAVTVLCIGSCISCWMPSVKDRSACVFLKRNWISWGLLLIWYCCEMERFGSLEISVQKAGGMMASRWCHPQEIKSLRNKGLLFRHSCGVALHRNIVCVALSVSCCKWSLSQSRLVLLGLMVRVNLQRFLFFFIFNFFFFDRQI